ncbi:MULTISPECIES: hypothetical protein [Acinetobacter]|uniref:hypothetical protein n=1 Tax=Acinetobacter TaxID=469 RepID=UPI00244A6BD1|nr:MULTISPECIES: hypothetical protein [Acinetobacter]MDH0031057.1 hypothetical protein [Acinetobacter sp. GD04021]MDH0886643.1 hypothetical protein [Acinetobacter sp. GD03873]MDH1083224.1 hypothetical protein [Acinetobacter sp. GD03983]MDH2189263.1 hypothetical protein [Acinetobacter sp. GD03645]MDH2202930.1 hypothetical protein [Acinetobacter sp. GD03647]
MQTLISSVVKRLRKVYQKAEEFIEEEREFSLSQVFVNATMERYVTEKVEIIKDLHADLYDGWLRLYATLDVKGIHTTLSVDLKLIQMEMNKDVQLMVFEQISNTQVIEARFKNIFLKWGFHTAIWYYQKFREEDPLGKILEHFDIVSVKDDLLYLDLNQWFSKKPSIIETLGKVHVNRARVRPAELIVWGNVNLAAILYPSNEDDLDEDGLDETEVTPIQQKDTRR